MMEVPQWFHTTVETINFHEVSCSQKKAPCACQCAAHEVSWQFSAIPTLPGQGPVHLTCTLQPPGQQQLRMHQLCTFLAYLMVQLDVAVHAQPLDDARLDAAQERDVGEQRTERWLLPCGALRVSSWLYGSRRYRAELTEEKACHNVCDLTQQWLLPQETLWVGGLSACRLLYTSCSIQCSQHANGGSISACQPGPYLAPKQLQPPLDKLQHRLDLLFLNHAACGDIWA